MILKKIWNHFLYNLTTMYIKLKFGDQLILGENVHWRKGFSLIIEKKGIVSIGNNCRFNFDCSLNCLGKLDVGENTILGENVKIYDHNHHFNKGNKLIMNQGMSIGSVLIGNNCWIGSNVVILKDTVIENNCVIGAGCIVSGHIPKNSILKNNNNYKMEKIVYSK